MKIEERELIGAHIVVGFKIHEDRIADYQYILTDDKISSYQLPNSDYIIGYMTDSSFQSGIMQVSAFYADEIKQKLLREFEREFEGQVIDIWIVSQPAKKVYFTEG